ncbi:MAG TPA: antibiotic biosynthesis monooxygenase family protein [Vicinamibacterales bacterium]|nr:antibiotic biosynthesis monooxygenase family protein [Vicinamibacterales bacterium]
MVLMSVALRVQSNKRAEVLSALDSVVERMRLRSGCARSRLFADAEDPDAYTVLSEFRSIDDADQFFASKEFQLLKGMRMLLRDEPSVVVDDIRRRVTRLVRE